MHVKKIKWLKIIKAKYFTAKQKKVSFFVCVVEAIVMVGRLKENYKSKNEQI